MKNDRSTAGTAAKVKSSAGKRAAKAGALLAVAGLTALAVAKSLKTPRGRAFKKKAKAAVAKTVRKVKRTARAATKRPATRARRRPTSR